MKHVGKMKNNGARIAIVFRTIPGDPLSALVIGTTGLGDAFHDALMSVIESDSGQQASELADILAVRRFPDGSNMLEWMHGRGYLKKVPTNLVWVTPDNKTQIQLDELNNLIANQKGITLDELSIKEESASGKASKEENIASKNKWDKLREEKAAKKLADSQPVVTDEPEVTLELTPAEMRSRADALYKEAARLRKEADAVDPPKKKAKAEEAEA
jgi:hypothetical protein